MNRRTVYGLLAALIVGLVGFGLEQAGYDGWHALLTTMIVVAVIVRLASRV